MEPSDFYFLVLPLAGLIALLVFIVVYNARREERQTKKFEKLMRKYMKEKKKQRELFNKQLEILDTQLHNKTIDKNTYARFKKMLEINFTKRTEKAHLQLEPKRP
jgi:hypothetical protein